MGCSNPRAASGVYAYDQTVRFSAVIGARQVYIQRDCTSGEGMLAGGTLGGISGNAIGGGTWRVILTMGGAILPPWQAVRLQAKQDFRHRNYSPLG